MSRGHGNTMEYLFSFICWTHWTRSEVAILLYRILWFFMFTFQTESFRALSRGSRFQVPGEVATMFGGFLLWTDNTHQAFHDVMIFGMYSQRCPVGRPFF